ncbi:MAG: molybdate ABC transporter substrate-binding protein [Gammaproteobacteria bacterium]|nr:molybdate ABC transporter substrate-binding protein [Gammaproteobacteria bacterium]
MRGLVRMGLLLVLLMPAWGTNAGVVSVAVASNFKDTLSELADRFEEQSGHTVRLSAASTGKHYAQIRNGAPFDIFLAADAERPALLVQEGFAVPDSQRTYAMGRLVFWVPRDENADCRAVLEQGVARVAMANPRTAPYGLAARQTLAALELEEQYAPRTVMGENISQAMQFVDALAAAGGFVAKSQWLVNPRHENGCAWEVPAELHDPIRQDMVLLKRGVENPAALAFLAYMDGADAKALIAASGYAIEE